MTSYERVSRCLEFRTPDRAPRELWDLPWLQQYARKEYEAFINRFPSDFTTAQALAIGERCRGEPSVMGNYTDAWGCVWTVAEDGVIGEVREPPLADWAALDHYQPPWEIFRRGDWGGAQRMCEANRKGPKKFMRCADIRPFERIQWLRGSENTFIDLGEEAPEFFRLLKMVHEFFVEELTYWLKLDCDGIFFPDDWAGQRGLLISPAQWRRVFKPLYKEYFEMVHKAGKKVFFHTDGNITDLYEEFIEIGVDAINSQLFCMDIEDLAKRFKGRITFWGEIDRQRILPFGSPDDAYRAVARVRKALDDGRGGVIGQCQWGIRNPPENIAAVFEAWDMPLPELLARTEGRVAAPPPSGANAATPAKVSSPFIEAEYRRYARGGNATLTGVASMKTAGGEVKPGAACVVTVVPATPYTRERFRLMSQYPRAQLEAPDSRLEAYTRTAVADANGKFTCDHLPAGDYILTCTIRWQYVGRMGLTTAKGQAVAYATVSEHQTKEVQLSG